MSKAGHRGKNLGASLEAIQHHYDVSNSFFQAWLDPSMTYTAGRWREDGRFVGTLEQAQVRKLDWHLNAAQVGPGSRVLDVGCGWGSLLKHAVRQRQAAEAVGITPSEQQSHWIQRHLGDAGIKVQQTVWQNVRVERPFDAVFSLGAIEHFARPELSADQRIQVYRSFFDFCRKSLADDGKLSLQFLGWMDVAPVDESANLPTELFPESNLPRFAEIISAADHAFHPLCMENVPKDYALTLQAWLSRINGRRDELIAEHGRDLVKMYIRGFRRFILGFEAGSLGLYRIAFRKRKF